MKNKHKLLKLVIFLGLGTFSLLGSLSGVVNDSSKVVHAAETTKTISSFNNVGSYSTNYTSQKYNNTSFYCYRCSSSSSKIVLHPKTSPGKNYADGGYDGSFFNTSEIGGITSVKVTFSGSSDASIQFGKDLYYTSSVNNIRSTTTYNAPSGTQAFKVNCGSSKMTISKIEYTVETSTTVTSFNYRTGSKLANRGAPQIASTSQTSITVPWTNGETKTLTKGSSYVDPAEIAAYYVAFGTWPGNYGKSGKTYKVSEYSRTDGYATAVPWTKSGVYYELDVDLDGTYTTSSRGVGRLVVWDKGFKANGYGSEPVVVYTDDHYASFQEYDNKGGFMHRFNAEQAITGYTWAGDGTEEEDVSDPVEDQDPTYIDIEKSKTILIGETVSINATVVNGTYTLGYYADDYDIANVDYSTGEVTGVSEGVTNVNVFAVENYSYTAVCEVIVVKNKIAPSSISVSGSKSSIDLDEEITLTATVLPSSAASTVTWSSSDVSVASVDLDGTVKGINGGNVVITATSVLDENVIGTFNISVIEPEEEGTATINTSSFGTMASGYGFKDFTSGSVTGKAFIYKNSNYMQFNSNQTYCYLVTNKLPGHINSVTVKSKDNTSYNWKLMTNSHPFVDTSKYPVTGNDQGTKEVTGSSVTWELTDCSDRYFSLNYMGSGVCYIEEIIITYGYSEAPAVLTGLRKEGTLATTSYYDGDSFDPTGLSIYAVYNDDSEVDVTSLVTWSPSSLREGNTSVTGTYEGATIIVSGLTVSYAIDAITVITAINSSKAEFANVRSTINDLSSIRSSIDNVNNLLSHYHGSTSAITNYDYAEALESAYSFLNDYWYQDVRILTEGNYEICSIIDSTEKVSELNNRYSVLSANTKTLLNDTFDVTASDGTNVKIGTSIEYIKNAYAIKVANNEESNVALTITSSKLSIVYIIFAIFLAIVLASLTIALFLKRKAKIIK